MGGALKGGQKLSIIVQIIGKNPETPKEEVEKFLKAVEKVVKDHGGTLLKL